MIDYYTLPKERQEELFREWLTRAVGKRVVFKEESFVNPSGSWRCFITEISDPSTWERSSYKVFDDISVDTVVCSEYMGRMISLPARSLDPMGWPEHSFMKVDEDVECEHDFDLHRPHGQWDYYEDWLKNTHEITCYPMHD